LTLFISVATIHAQEGLQASNADEAALIAINRQFILNFLNNDTVGQNRGN
jgi:hypothetical protein